MQSFVRSLFLFLFIPFFAFADDGAPVIKSAKEQIKFENKVFSINKDFDALRVRLKNEWQGYAVSTITNGIPRENVISPTVCSPLAEVPHTYFCTTYKQRDQNKIFSRLSIFSEGYKEKPAGNVIELGNPWLEFFYEEVGGHDLKSKEITSFFNDATILTGLEEAFKDVFELMVKEQGETPFHVITTSIQNGMDIKVVASHEALHAQYFEYEKIRSAVKSYWYKNVSEKDRDAIMKELSIVYDVKNEYVLLNEFFSYSLEKDASVTGRLREFAPRIAAPFRKYIETTTGIKTINLK